MINLEKYSLISFDMFQTLVDLNSQKTNIMKRILKEAYTIEIANHFWSDANDFVYKYFHKIANNDQPYKTVEEIFTQCYEELFKKYKINHNPRKGAHVLAKFHNASELYQESLEIVNRIKKTKKVCIISDTDDIMIKSLIKKFKIDKLYTSQSYQTYKFDKSGRLFYEAIKDFNIKPNEMLHIGDGINDVLGANLIGADSVWVNRSNRIWTDDSRPTYEIKSLRDLIE